MFITINGQAEFPDAIGEFLLDEYPDRATLNINEDSPSVSTSSQQTASSTPTPTSSTQQPTNFSQTTSSRFSKRVLTTVKVIRADLGGDGKPTNIHAHNLTVHVNIYKEEDARVPYILQKVQSSMDDDILVLVGPNGLIYYDQEGTRGINTYVYYVRLFYKNMPRLSFMHFIYVCNNKLFLLYHGFVFKSKFKITVLVYSSFRS